MNTTAITMTTLVNPLTYAAYRSLMEELVADQTTTGEEQTEQKIGFTKLNLQRMRRVEKQFVLTPELHAILAGHTFNWQWLVLAEAWCGDGAQLIPALATIAEQVPGIELTVLLRDENPDLMETCLTNGSRSIPKLICLDAGTGERLFTWGPRPESIKEKAQQFKLDNPDADHDTFVLNLHTWYAKDRSQSLQQDMLNILQEVFADRQMLV